MKFNEWITQVQIVDHETITTYWPTEYYGQDVEEEKDFVINDLERFTENEPIESMESVDTDYLCTVCDCNLLAYDLFPHWEEYHKEQ